MTLSKRTDGRLDAAETTVRPPNRRRFGSFGFTLVEMAVVLIILSIILVAAIPSFSAKNARSRAEGAARQLAARMELARQKAIARRVPYRLVLDAGARTYRFETQDTDSTWAAEPDQTYEIEGVENLDCEIGGSPTADEVYFETRGTIRSEDSPTEIRFISALNDTATLSLVRTGRVSVLMSH